VPGKQGQPMLEEPLVHGGRWRALVLGLIALALATAMRLVPLLVEDAGLLVAARSLLARAVSSLT
jgi:hypothetical protein